METLKDVVQEDEGRGHTPCKDLSYYRWLNTGEQECFGRQVTAEGVMRWTESGRVCCLQNSKARGITMHDLCCCEIVRRGKESAVVGRTL